MKFWRARKERTALVRATASELVATFGERAYYEAHRGLARARRAGERATIKLWLRVPAVVARISKCPMDMTEVRRVVADEETRG
jgi:hypothetical protein